MPVSQTYWQSVRQEATFNGKVVEFKRYHNVYRLGSFVTFLLLNHPNHWVTVEESIKYIYNDIDNSPLWANQIILQILIKDLTKLGVKLERWHGIGFRIPIQERG